MVGNVSVFCLAWLIEHGLCVVIFYKPGVACVLNSVCWLVGNMSVFCMAEAAGLSSAVAGGVAGSVEAVFMILISAAICYWRSEQFFSLIF